MRVFLSIALLLSTVLLIGQTTPIPGFYLSEDGNQKFCSPGIANKSRSKGLEIAYMVRNGGMIRPEENQLAGQPGELDVLESAIFKLRVPVINSPDFKLIAGFNYEPEKYDVASAPIASVFSSVSPNFSDVFTQMDSRRLKNTAFNLMAVKSIDSRHYLGLRLRASYTGDYNGLVNFDKRYAGYMASAVYGIKKNNNFEYGFGVNFSKDFRRMMLLPFIVYNRNFSSKWGVEAVFPASVQGRYNIDPKNILMFGYEYSSQSFSMDVENGFTGLQSPYNMSHSELLFGASLERQIVPWVWLNIKGGLQYNLPTRFDALSPDAVSFRATPAAAPYLRVGFFVSPPDRRHR